MSHAEAIPLHLPEGLVRRQIKPGGPRGHLYSYSMASTGRCRGTGRGPNHQPGAQPPTTGGPEGVRGTRKPLVQPHPERRVKGMWGEGRRNQSRDIWVCLDGLEGAESLDPAPSSHHSASLGKVGACRQACRRPLSPQGISTSWAESSGCSSPPLPSPAMSTFPKPKNSHSHPHLWLALLPSHCARQNV